MPTATVNCQRPLTPPSGGSCRHAFMMRNEHQNDVARKSNLGKVCFTTPSRRTEVRSPKHRRCDTMASRRGVDTTPCWRGGLPQKRLRCGAFPQISLIEDINSHSDPPTKRYNGEGLANSSRHAATAENATSHTVAKRHENTAGNAVSRRFSANKASQKRDFRNQDEGKRA